MRFPIGIPWSLLFNSECKEMTIDSMKCLTDKEKLIIEGRFLSEKKMTLAEISSKINISGERVRQIECKALGKMRAYIEELERVKKIDSL